MVPLSLSHRLWRLLPEKQRRRVFARLAGWAAPRAADFVPPDGRSAVIAGEFTRASGLGEGARLMHAALLHEGVNTAAVAAGLGPDGAPLAYPGLVSLHRTPAGAPLIVHVNAPSFAASLLKLPRHALRGRKIIGYWAWELSTLPIEWQGAQNLCHEIWVPSHFTAAALAPFYPGRLRVVPHPLAASFGPVVADRAGFGLPDDALVVLLSVSLASGAARKNPQAGIAAFKRAFAAGHAIGRDTGDDTGRATGRDTGHDTGRATVLVVKAGQASHDPAALAALRGLIGNAPNIILITKTLTTEQNRALIASSDIVLSLHRSEGFGLVPAEALLCGRAVVATDYGGSTDFLRPEHAVLVPYRLIDTGDASGVYSVPNAVWADPDIDAAAAALIMLANDAQLRARLGAAGRAFAIKYFSAEPLLAALANQGTPS